jgi:hypothetical protein
MISAHYIINRNSQTAFPPRIPCGERFGWEIWKRCAVNGPRDLKRRLFGEPLPWTRYLGMTGASEDLLARLDECLRTNPIRDGFISRTHFQDACASLWLKN